MARFSFSPRIALPAFMLVGTMLVGAVIRSDTREIQEHTVVWRSIIDSVAGGYIVRGDLVGLSSLVRSEPGFSVLICSLEGNSLVSTGVFEDGGRCPQPQEDPLLKPLLVDSRQVGFARVEALSLFRHNMKKYLVIVGAWLLGAFSIAGVLARRADLAAMDDIARALGTGHLADSLSEETRQNPRWSRLVQILIQAQQAELENARNRATYEVACQVAHDIRSPLAALNAVMMTESRLSPDEAQLLAMAIRRIRSIASDLLSPSRAGDAEGQEPLVALVESQVREARLQYRHRNELRFELDVDDQMVSAAEEPRLSMALEDLRRALSNLLNNAVEATPGSGAIRVRVSKCSGGVQLLVRDEGIGIPSELLPSLGTRGVTLGKKLGSGLGLYQVRSCVEAAGGSLAIRSQSGQGTEVELRIPVKGSSVV